MSCRSFPEFRRRLAGVVGRCLLLSLAGLLPLVAVAATQVLPFGPETWQQLQTTAERPTLVVFSTSDCVHCPAVIDALGGEVRRSGGAAKLIVVVMDGRGQESLLLRSRLYKQAQALYAFAGDETALRYSVNPAWRGLTPYVGLIGGGEPRFFTGPPPDTAVRDFIHRPPASQ